MLADLFAGSLQDSQSRQLEVTHSDLENAITALKPPISLNQAFPKRPLIHVIAEIKRASPSKGVLSEIDNPVQLARDYESAGASCISVLTEQRRFLGSLEDLKNVRSGVSLPLIRKDFISSEYQLLEARFFGADIALLIVAGLDHRQLQRLFEFTVSLGMTPFVETHNESEVIRALELDARMIGINARNLETFETDRNLFGSLVDLIPEGVVKVAESAVRTVSDVVAYRESGADVVLVGEALVTGNARDLINQFVSVT